MQKILLFFFFLVLSGCSFNNPFPVEEVDKVTVVQYTPYIKHHRAYFSREPLHILKNKKKYHFVYNKKTKDIAVILHKKDKYLLYNMSKPTDTPLFVPASSAQKYKNVLNQFKKKGFAPISSLSSVGYTASISPRKYKGIKTLLIETKKYSKLQSLYQKALKSYDASKIKNIKTKLPKILIDSYYNRYKKLAKTKAQRIQINIIAKKLGYKLAYTLEKNTKKEHIPLTKKQKNKDISKPVVKNIHAPKEKKTTTIHTQKQEKTQEEPIPKKEKQPRNEPYSYYLNDAPLSELSAYISNKATKNLLSYNQYNMLTQRKIHLQEEELFKHGSLEELIAAYKVNKNPKYKQRIMSLMKDKQRSNP